MEINIEVYDRNFGETLNHELELLTKNHCEEVTLDSYSQSISIFKKFNQWFSYKVVSISEMILDMFTRRIN